MTTSYPLISPYPPPRPNVPIEGTVLEPSQPIDPDCYLFLGDPEHKTFSPFYRWWMPVSMAIGFGLGSLITHSANRLPFRAGIQRHIKGALFGGVAGELGWRGKQHYDSERDIQYFHYMAKHPEDFPVPERRQYASVLKPWLPFR